MTSETIADIVAEMRRGTRLPGYWRSCDVNEILQYHADRIEAAAKREREKADALSAGGLVEAMRHKPSNAAAMREALCEIVLLTVKAGKSISCDVACGIIASKAKHALAAPPRNCDRFRDWDSAAAEYERLVQEGKAEDGTWCEWLFSVGQYASAQEGAANA